MRGGRGAFKRLTFETIYSGDFYNYMILTERETYEIKYFLSCYPITKITEKDLLDQGIDDFHFRKLVTFTFSKNLLGAELYQIITLWKLENE
jgi:hypothetical protein